MQTIEQREEISKLKEKYLGKYFKFHTSFFGAETEKNFWWIYIKITKITSIHFLWGITIQRDIYGLTTSNTEDEISESMCSIEMTKEEFDGQVREIISKIESDFLVNKK